MKLRPKVFEALTYLVQNPNRLVAKDELMKALWPDSFVTDDSLVQCFVELRRALGDEAAASSRPCRGGATSSRPTSRRRAPRARRRVSPAPEPAPSAAPRRLLVPLAARGRGAGRARLRRPRRPARAPAFTDKDSILIADFANTTGDEVFDGTLRQAMAVQLGQSPFLNVFSEERVRETLRYMGRSPDEPRDAATWRGRSPSGRASRRCWPGRSRASAATTSSAWRR